MVLHIPQKLRRFAPEFDSPMLKVPRGNIIITSVVNVIQDAVLQYEISGEIIYVRVCGVQQGTHFPDLINTVQRQFVIQNHFKYCFPINILFYNLFPLNIKITLLYLHLFLVCTPY